ncbi:MAG: energy transducer TonB [Acidobacteriota bacterium]
MRTRSLPLLIFFFIAALIIPTPSPGAHRAQVSERQITIAVLGFADTGIGRQTASSLAATLRAFPNLSLVDPDQARAAATGAGYAASLNMSLTEARTLGAAIGSDFYMLGEAQTLRRSPSTGPRYFESYASIFLVSSRSGRLVTWERPSFQAATPAAAEKQLLATITDGDFARRTQTAIHRAQEEERTAREMAIEKGTPVIEAAPADDTAAETQGVRLPRPYRRLQPAYPDSAARAEVEAVVDVLVDLDADGEVSHVEVARWAGFGLDQVTLDTVRQLHFFPALRNGTPIPLRVLLRYNFRKPPR